MNKAWLVVVLAAFGGATGSTPDVPSNGVISSASPRITEVALHYVDSSARNKILRMDPGYVDLVFFDDSARATYFSGLRGATDSLIEIAVSDLVQNARRFFRDDVSDTVATNSGFSASVTIHANGRWYRIRDIDRAQALVMLYEGPNRAKYSLTLPLRPSTMPESDVRDVGADVVFWNLRAMAAYREGLSLKGQIVTNPAIALWDGTYKVPVVRSDTTFRDAYYRPKKVQAAGVFRATAASICYHFESCQWVCDGD